MSEHKTPNSSIRCTVADCRYHCDSNYCTLDVISVVSHDAVADKYDCTDCSSFDAIG